MEQIKFPNDKKKGVLKYKEIFIAYLSIIVIGFIFIFIGNRKIQLMSNEEESPNK